MSDSQLSTGEQLQSAWKLGGLRIPQLAKRVWEGLNEHDLFGLSSQLAYNFIVALFPMLLFLLALFGLFASRGTELHARLLFYLSQVLPPAAYDIVTKTIEEVTRNSSSGKLTLGILLALFSASAGINSMISGLNQTYEVRDHRPWYKVRLLAIALTIAISFLVTTALIIIVAGGWIAIWVGGLLRLANTAIILWRVTQAILALLFLSGAFSLIYYFGPDLKEQHWYWITPGSIVGVLVWISASLAFRAYLHFFNTFSRTYGSLGAVIILLLWFYVTGLSFLLGGEINAQVEHAAAEHGHPEAKATGEKVSSTG